MVSWPLHEEIAEALKGLPADQLSKLKVGVALVASFFLADFHPDQFGGLKIGFTPEM
jgi:hypothetical protein